MVNSIVRKALVLCFMFCSLSAFSQRYLAGLDTLMFIRDTVRPFLQRFDNLHFSGYIQPQFQLAEREGISSYNGPDFSDFSKSRFMLRRARIKVDYLMTKNKLPQALFTFQFDATERGAIVRDMFLRLYETKGNNFSITTGVFARPYGYEVNLSSAFRESPERGRMSQILMPAERDLGAMISFEPQQRSSNLKWLKIDAGIFNGQGLSGSTDFDSRKDVIARATLKPVKVSQTEISGGLSFLHGGWRQATKYVFTPGSTGGNNVYKVDSSLSNIGRIAQRTYYGADVQVKFNHGWGETELRAEYWEGRQPGTAATSTSPGNLPVEPTYIRDFNGAFFYLLQNIINKKHQLILKYDWYDPATNVKGADIGKAGTNLSATDIRYSTIGAGYTYYHSDKVKLVLYYDFVKNEDTLLPDYDEDVNDNIFTCRLQFRF